MYLLVFLDGFAYILERLVKMNRQMLDDMAAEVIHKHNIDPSNGYDIVSLAKAMGFFVATAALDDNEDGFIIVNGNEKDVLGTGSSKVIVVNEARDQEMKRFIIAHELGHYSFNGKEKEIFAHRKNKDYLRSENEQEIDYFAASLLMPKDAFKEKNRVLSEEKKGLSARTLELSRIFLAPLESVLRRIEELNLVISEDNL